MMHHEQFGASVSGLGEGRVGGGACAGRPVNAEHDRRVGRREIAPHDHHRAVRVPGCLNADRTGQQPGEAAESAVADDEEFGIA